MPRIDHNSPYILEIADVLSLEECQALITKIDAMDPYVAPINTAFGPQLHTDVRNNERVMFDDEDLAGRLFDKARDRVPDVVLSLKLVSANERIRCYRYKPGMRFAPHRDGSFRRDDSEQSLYSYLVYLNAGFKGGETRFFTEPEIAVKPEVGKGLLFQHSIIHEGALVTEGVKYVARTDLMFRRQAG